MTMRGDRRSRDGLAGGAVFVAVPVKDLVNAKQRLVPVLTPDERRALAQAMLEDVLTALDAALPGTARVVTTDARVIEVARRHRAECLVEPANRGHTEAVALAQQQATVLGLTRFLTIPGDIPCVTPAELRAICAALGEANGVALVPSLSGFGTNAALLAPPDAMPLKFGEPSFGNHLLAARQRGMTPVVLELPGVGLDVDAPEDLEMLLRRGRGTRSGILLASWGFPARLCPR